MSWIRTAVQMRRTARMAATKRQIIIKKIYLTRKTSIFTDLSSTSTVASTRRPSPISSNAQASCIRIKSSTRRTSSQMRTLVMTRMATSRQQELET